MLLADDKEMIFTAGDVVRFADKDIQQIAWNKYGFRTGVTGGNYDVSSVGVNGLPQSIDTAVSGLRVNIYNRLIEYLGQ